MSESQRAPRPTNPAPVLKRSGYSTRARKVDESYAAWAAHYNACAACQHEDWFSPDEDFLCPVGYVLFNTWSRAATTMLL